MSEGAAALGWLCAALNGAMLASCSGNGWGWVGAGFQAAAAAVWLFVWLTDRMGKPS